MSLVKLLTVPGRQLRLKKREHVDYCSETASVLRMDYDAPSPFGAQTKTVSLVSTGGRIDGLMQWIRLEFGAGETLESDPFSKDGATSRGATVFDFAAPLETEPGDIVEVTVAHKDLPLLVEAVARPRRTP